MLLVLVVWFSDDASAFATKVFPGSLMYHTRLTYDCALYSCKFTTSLVYLRYAAIRGAGKGISASLTSSSVSLIDDRSDARWPLGHSHLEQADAWTS